MADGESISNHWITAKKIGKGSMAAGGAGVNALQHYAGVSAFALATGAAAASATGIGLVVTGAAITVATCGFSALSAYKSSQHAAVLEKIQQREGGFECSGLMFMANRREHQHIVDDVLPYLILQKQEKSARKAVGAVPIAGSALTSAYSLGRYVYKRAKGTLGATRNQMAFDLTKHFLTHNCALAQAIVSELYSFEEMTWLAEQAPDEVIKLLARKMTSN
ncbi:MAG TPA: hypothetical protein VKS60_12960 [Stellaceae bacterium]|jgi:hypothetical protein|nr:hypothetical protein [Stellaceae bacterium]